MRLTSSEKGSSIANSVIMIFAILSAIAFSFPSLQSLGIGLTITTLILFLYLRLFVHLLKKYFSVDIYANLKILRKVNNTHLLYITLLVVALMILRSLLSP